MKRLYTLFYGLLLGAFICFQPMYLAGAADELCVPALFGKYGDPY